MSSLVAGARRAAAPRTAPTANRQRVQLLLAGLLVGGATAAAVVCLDLLDVQTFTVASVLGPLVVAVGVGAALGSVPVARRNAGRVLTGCLALAALGGAALLGLVSLVLILGRLPAPGERPVMVPALVGAAVAAAAYAPLRAFLGSLTARSTTGLRRTPEEVLETFGDRTTRDTPVEELLRQLAEALRDWMGLSTVEIWTGGNERLTRLLSVPHRAAPQNALGIDDTDVLRRAGVAGEAWLRMWLPGLLLGRGDAQVRVAPVRYGHELLGLFVVERPREAQTLRGADERALGELSRRLGVLLHNRALDAALQASLEDLQHTNEELRASRHRLVSAADAERRRIERDIHDGAQQHLAALAVNLGLARQMLADGTEDVAAVRELLDELATDVRATIAEVRNLAHGVYPPLLRQSGLVAALRSAAQRASGPVTFTAENVARESAGVEAAVYFCALEALQNAGKHAPDAAVTVALTSTGGELRLEVTDDGPGFDPATTSATGQGRQNMTDRLGAVGGTVRWESAPGQGTRVVVTVPTATSRP